MRLIDADELKTAFPSGETIRTESVKATINHMPTAEKKGRWIVVDGQVVCSECYNANIETNYCPTCGARMEESDG